MAIRVFLGDSGALVPVNTLALFPEPNEPSTGLMHARFSRSRLG